MKKVLLIIALFSLGFMVSCTKNFEELNTDTKHPTDVPGNYVFSNAEYLLSYHMTTNNVNVGIFNLMGQYITETTYTDEANWDLANRTIADNFFRRVYSDLKQLKIAKELIAKEDAVGDEALAVQKNRIAIIDLLSAYMYQVAVDIWGNVPYSEALDPDNVHPKYDDAAEIYDSLIIKVQNALASMDVTYGSFDGADFFYNGDVAQWKKFGNALLIKMAINLYDTDQSTATSLITGAADKTFTSVEDGAYFPFTPGSPYYNPIYEDFVASGRSDFVVTGTFIDAADTVLDTRLLAEVDTEGVGYVGGPYGVNNNFDSYAHVGSTVLAPDFKGLILTYDEVLFYLAEAAAKGMVGLPKTAQEYYDDAITASFEFWGADSAAAYIAAHPYVDVNSVALESWKASFMKGLVGWTTYRRVDGGVPLVMPPFPPQGVTSIPTRFTYPINEQTLNAEQYNAAADAIGGDLLSTPIFWDKN